MEDKERIVHLEQVTEELERRVSLLESVCGSTQMEAEIPGEQEVTISTNGSSTSTDFRSLMAIGGDNNIFIQRSAEVLNTSCDFPLPEGRYGHISVTTADGKTLVCGVWSPSGPTASCLQFNPESKTWENHSSMKSERYFPSTIVLSSGLYILGGRDYDYDATSEFLATGSSEWTQGPDIPGEGMYESCAAKLPIQSSLYSEGDMIVLKLESIMN